MLASHDQRYLIWLIDENKRELRTHANTLRKILPPSVEVRTLEAYKNLEDYLPILEERKTACIITDQRLKVTGIATYTGIELAEFLRRINSKIPLYILTNFADIDDFTGGEWAVEDIIRKKDLLDQDEQKTLASRIIRRINIYEDIRSEREQRFKLLLMKSMNGELENTELQELDEIRLQKMAPGLAEELTQIQQMEQVVKSHKELMSHFKSYVSRNVEDGNDVL